MGQTREVSTNGAGSDHELQALRQRVAELEAAYADIQQQLGYTLEQQRQQEDLLQLVIRHNPSAIAVLDQDLHYLAVSDRYLQDYNVAGQEVLGHHHYAIFPEVPQHWRAIHQRCLAGAIERSDEDSFVRQDGSIDYNRWECRPWYNAAGEIAGIIMFTEVITERKRIEHELRHSQTLLQHLLDHIPSVIYIADLQGRMLFVNQPYTTLLGLDRDAVVGKTSYDLFPSEVADGWQRETEQILASGALLKTEHSLPMDDGLHTFETIKFPIADPAGAVYAIGGISTDITARKQIEEQLATNEERLQFVLEGSSDGAWDVNLVTGESYLSLRYLEMLGYAEGEISGSLETWLGLIHPDDRAQVEQQFQDYLAGKLAIYEIEHRLGHKSGDWRWMLGRGKITARDEQGHPVRMTGTITDITARRQATAEIERLGRILEDSANEIYIFTADTLRFTRVNRGARQNLGYTMEELAQLTAVDIKPLINHTEFAALIDPLREDATRLLTFETVHQRKDGTTYPVDVRLQLSHEEEGSLFVAVIQDITERKQAEEELAIFKLIIDHFPDGVGMIDQTGTLTYANLAYGQMTGYGADLVGMQVSKLAPPDVAAPLLSDILPVVFQPGGIWTGELPYQRKDGSTFTALLSGFAARDSQGQVVGLAAIIRDLTEQKRAAAELATSQQQLQFILEGSNDGAWDFNLVTSETYVSPRYLEILGYAEGELPNRSEMWMELIYPDDRAQVTDLFQAHLAGATPIYTVEHRMRHKAGDWRWMLSRGKVTVRDEQGQPLRMTGTATDITLRKQAEEDLMLFKLLVENSPDGIGVADQMGNLTYANPAYGRMTGYGAEMVGMNTSHLVAPEAETGLIERVIETALQPGGSWSGEVPYQHKDGRTLPVLVSVFAARNAAGQVVGLPAIVRDLTAQKRAEAYQRNLAALVENSKDFIGIATPEGQPVYMNEAGRRLVGLPSIEAVQQTKILDYFFAEDLAYVQEEILPTVLREGMWRGEVRFRHFQTDESIAVDYNLFSIRESATGRITALGSVTRDIRDQKRAQEEQQRLAAVVENSSDFIGMGTLDGYGLYLNRAGRDLIGLDPDQDIGHILLQDFHMPEDLPQFGQELIPTVMRKGEWAGEFRLRHFQTGAAIPIFYNFLLVKDQQTGQPVALAAIIRDLTEQKRAEEYQRNLATLVENSSDFIAVASLQGDALFVNAAGQRLVGLPNTTAVQQTKIFDYLFPEDLAYVQEQLIPTVMREGTWRGEFRFRHFETGERIAVDYGVFAIRDRATGEIAAIGTVTRDIRDQKHQEAERAALQEQIIQAQKDALRELSTPLLPITDQVVVMPLIGSIDSQRAAQVMEALLDGVARQQARLAILDITGVQVVDTQVANALIDAARAVRLLGARVMLTGIQPQIAQTLVQLGVDLGDILTRSSLQSGIAAALRQQ